ncbi:MAG TPA: hypothetical protein VEF89_25055 [Solirubrobacteraceae bacterium]|nr:hypothetical protein [Solirubrobacteraceae bacterium]
MSRLKHPITTGRVVSLPLAAIAPATAAATLTPHRARRERRPPRYSSCMSHHRGNAGIRAVGAIGTATLAAGGGVLAMRRDRLDPAAR